ncbi:hypothetical protein DPMN_177125 [Dreissena polymorpha]|uniref:Uncharacterized protein n=1 Tax=Dreissena polymorpha TaxID=45954 RepID=A0A9D4EAP4_DREPO|nr:hypothetical protein DPMN_177125 [Dreissena polymorpha]
MGETLSGVNYCKILNYLTCNESRWGRHCPGRTAVKSFTTLPAMNKDGGDTVRDEMLLNPILPYLQ